MRHRLRRGPVAVVVPFVVALASCRDPTAHAGTAGTFSGAYEMTTIDGVALPTTIVTGFTGVSMDVQQGQLAFDGSSLLLTITGPLNGNGNAVTLGAGARPYTRIGADSLESTFGVGGRVWADSADLTTLSGTLTGAHRFRFVRAR